MKKYQSILHILRFTALSLAFFVCCLFPVNANSDDSALISHGLGGMKHTVDKIKLIIFFEKTVAFPAYENYPGYLYSTDSLIVTKWEKKFRIFDYNNLLNSFPSSNSIFEQIKSITNYAPPVITGGNFNEDGVLSKIQDDSPAIVIYVPEDYEGFLNSNSEIFMNTPNGKIKTSMKNLIKLRPAKYCLPSFQINFETKELNKAVLIINRNVSKEIARLCLSRFILHSYGVVGIGYANSLSVLSGDFYSTSLSKLDMQALYLLYDARIKPGDSSLRVREVLQKSVE